jgi:hypothetical protein
MPPGMDSVGNKWAAGTSCTNIYFHDSTKISERIQPTDGPVLSQTDLYLLNTELEIHPILANKHGSFHLVFNLVTGSLSFVSHPTS